MLCGRSYVSYGEISHRAVCVTKFRKDYRVELWIFEIFLHIYKLIYEQLSHIFVCSRLFGPTPFPSLEMYL